MYCVIQRIVNKKANPYGAHKELLSITRTSYAGTVPRTYYSYRYSDERFERPIKDAYKITIHHSYREEGKVKKRQWSICTMSHYDLLTSPPEDCINGGLLKEKLAEMGISEGELWDLVYAKLNPIIEKVHAEFAMTEEHKINREHHRILEQHRIRKKEFDEKYGADTYEQVYDVFGELQDGHRLKVLEEKLRESKEYQERSYQSHQQSNYDYSDFFKSSGYSVSSASTYNDDEKAGLKKLFRHLSKTFHPDITKDNGEMMKLINKLKEQWGI